MPKIKELIQPPPEPEGGAEEQLAAIRDYLVKITQELLYLLTHLEADNINDSTFQKIAQMIPKPYVGQPLMDGTASSGGSGNWSRGDHRHPADTSKADVTALEEEAALLAAHVGDHTNPHEVTAAQVGLGNVANERQYSAQNPPPTPSAADVGAIPVTAKGSAGGVAELDANGMVPSAQLPSYVDDVLEYASFSNFPATGENGKIYVALDTNRTYRWSGSAYVEISASLALGETSSTAYRGDRGKTAYDHSQLTSGNPHNVSASDVGLGNVANERQYSANNPPPLPTPADIGAATAQDLTDHVGDTNNPHGVTAAQVGARPDTWMPTAAQVGARPDTWTPTAADVGARPDTWTPTAADVGARPDDWVPDAEDVPYDNTQSGLMATDVQAAIDEIAQGGGGGGTAASAVSYDNTGSGLTATNVQDAIDEVIGDIPTQPADIGLGNVANERQYSAQNKPGAADVTYTSTDPRISATDVQGAVDELISEKADIADLPFPARSDELPVMDGTANQGAGVEYARWDHVHPSDTTKANQTQLAVVETGTTASVAHAVGAYFCLNGLLYRATAAISVGQSFTPGTNCYQTTVMDMVPPRIIGGDLNNYTTPGLYMWTDAAASVPTNAPIVAQSVLIVLQASQAGRVCQIVFAHNATRNGAYYRWLFSNAWTSWYTIG